MIDSPFLGTHRCALSWLGVPGDSCHHPSCAHSSGHSGNCLDPRGKPGWSLVLLAGQDAYTAAALSQRGQEPGQGQAG